MPSAVYPAYTTNKFGAESCKILQKWALEIATLGLPMISPVYKCAISPAFSAVCSNWLVESASQHQMSSWKEHHKQHVFADRRHETTTLSCITLQKKKKQWSDHELRNQTLYIAKCHRHNWTVQKIREIYLTVPVPSLTVWYMVTTFPGDGRMYTDNGKYRTAKVPQTVLQALMEARKPLKLETGMKISAVNYQHHLPYAASCSQRTNLVSFALTTVHLSGYRSHNWCMQLNFSFRQF